MLGLGLPFFGVDQEVTVDPSTIRMAYSSNRQGESDRTSTLKRLRF